LPYGAGRVFHTVLGHADYSMRCPGFQTLLLRGTEWAATGEVTMPISEELSSMQSTE
jgi:type 1 glutamine amidotransferase